MPLRFPPTLQVAWLSFEARAIERKVQLLWETSAEINHDYFEIERSRDLIASEIISDQVPGKGTSNTGAQYTIFDERPISGTSFYRVKATDRNGDESHSEWEEVWFEQSGSMSLVVYPNPVKNILTTRISSLQEEDISLIVIDLHGKTLYSHTTRIDQGETTLKVNLQAYAEGIYFLKISSKEGISKTVRVVKSN